MLIGIDFDNTIASYDHVFAAAAEREGLIGTGAAVSKVEVKRQLQAKDNGEETWMRLQGRVYGAFMHEAELIDGVGAFLSRCRGAGIEVCIVSHKTETGHFDPDKINLRDAARAWMRNLGFFRADSFGLSESAVYFEPTLAEKVARISALGCTHFIDDLEEVFNEPGFPEKTRRYLLARGSEETTIERFQVFRDWTSITHAIFALDD